MLKKDTKRSEERSGWKCATIITSRWRDRGRERENERKRKNERETKSLGRQRKEKQVKDAK